MNGKNLDTLALTGKVLPRTTPATAITPAIVVQEIISAVSECLRTREIETTKRQAIAAKKKIAIKQIETDRAVALRHLDRSFNERERTLSALLVQLDKASGDAALTERLLEVITTLASQCPLDDLRDFGRPEADF